MNIAPIIYIYHNITYIIYIYLFIYILQPVSWDKFTASLAKNWRIVWLCLDYRWPLDGCAETLPHNVSATAGLGEQTDACGAARRNDAGHGPFSTASRQGARGARHRRMVGGPQTECSTKDLAVLLRVLEQSEAAHGGTRRGSKQKEWGVAGFQ